MSKHTNGPWTVGHPTLLNDGSRPVMGRDAFGDQVRVAVVDCHADFKRGEGWKAECAEREANARLIAAAPDLLAVCESILAHDDTAHAHLSSAEIVQQARAAIAKAKEV